jgi:hypothetical protein
MTAIGQMNPRVKPKLNVQLELKKRKNVPMRMKNRGKEVLFFMEVAVRCWLCGSIIHDIGAFYARSL